VSTDRAPQGSALAGRIRSRGYWHVVIRPTIYDRRRFGYQDLERVIRSARVSLRGWDVPHVDDSTSLVRGDEWIGSEVDWKHHLELWRFYLSGQFVHLNGLWNDWRDRSSMPPQRSDRPQGRTLGVTETLWSLGEYFELASRLALAVQGDHPVVIRLRLSGLADRKLVVDDPRRAPFFTARTTSMETFDSEEISLTSEQLVTNGRQFAVDTAVELFARFGWDPSPELLLDNLNELWSRR
jgi:hypothetical protein